MLKRRVRKKCDENNQCRITIRVDGVEELKATLGSVKKVGDGEYELNGIPAGGPYDFSLIADNEEIRYEKMYVGDVWLLGGQSNMEGAGDMTERDFYDQKHPNERVRAFYMVRLSRFCIDCGRARINS